MYSCHFEIPPVQMFRSFLQIAKFPLHDFGFDLQNENNALCYAVFNNHVDSVKILLEWGADITRRNKDGHCAIDIAILQGIKDGTYN